MTAAAQTAALTVAEIQALIKDPEERIDLLDLASIALKHRRTELGRELMTNEFATIEWPEVRGADLRVFEDAEAIVIRDAAGHTVATFA